ASVVEVMQRPYIRTAVLKGLPFRAVILRHALRNAMLTPITVIMLQVNYLIAGVVVVETVFAYPGFGRMILEAALFKDIALIEAGALVAVFLAVLTNVRGVAPPSVRVVAAARGAGRIDARQRRRRHRAGLGGAGAARPADRAVPTERQRHGGARPRHPLEGALARDRSARARPALAHPV